MLAAELLPPSCSHKILSLRIWFHDDNTLKKIGLRKHIIRGELCSIINAEEHGRCVGLETCNGLRATSLTNSFNGLANTNRYW